MKEKKVRNLAAVMFSDIVGYTALMEGDEGVAAKIRTLHREVFQQKHALHHGEKIQYYGDGMTEEIINALAKIKELKVTSRTSSFFFKNRNIPISEIGNELNVSIILEGSIRLASKQMRITAQLIDVGEDFHFWSETWDRELDNINAYKYSLKAKFLRN